MNRFVLFFCFLNVPLWADIEIQQPINEVYYQGNHQLGGSTTATITADDFHGVSPENPIFYNYKLQGAVLADTLVDQNSQDPLLSQPIYLACELVTLVEGVSLTMPGNAVSIVRWVAGEEGVWFKVQVGSETWLQDAQGQSFSPNHENRVSWTYGVSARSSVADHGDPSISSMLANSRSSNPQNESDATSTLICVNLENSSLQLGRRLEHDLVSYGSEAETSFGVYAATTVAPVNFSGGFEIARGKDLAVTHAQLKERNSKVLARGDGQLLIQADFTLDVQAESMPGHITASGYLVEGSVLKLTSLDDGGFSEDGAWFNDVCGSFGSTRVVAESAYESNGDTLYREIELVWNQSSQFIGFIELGVGFNLTLPPGQSDGVPRVSWSLALPWHDGPAGYEHFDGPDQLRRCEAQMLPAMEGEWQIAGSNTSDRFLSHITEPGNGFTTTLIFANYTTEERGYLLRGYTVDGSSLGTMAGILSAGEKRRVSAPELFDNPALSHLRLAAANEIRVSAVYQAEGEGKTAAHLHESAETAYNWLMKLGDRSLTFDAFALVNLGAATSQVTIRQVGENGGTILSSVFELAPMAKLLHVLPARSGVLDVFIEATEKSAITALRGSHDSSLIWENRAVVSTY